LPTGPLSTYSEGPIEIAPLADFASFGELDLMARFKMLIGQFKTLDLVIQSEAS
jgi:hypothetical protein